MTTKNKIADNINKALQKKGWSQTHLAEQLGKKRGHINKWCTGRHTPDPENMVKIAEALGYTVEELVSGNFRDEMDEPYGSLVNDTIESILDKIDVVARIDGISEKKLSAYKKSVRREIDMIIELILDR